MIRRIGSVWIVTFVWACIILGGSQGFAETFVLGGMFLTLPALLILFLFVCVENMFIDTVPKMPWIIGILIAIGIPAACAAFLPEKTGWDVIIQAILPVTLVLGISWAISPQLIAQVRME